MKTARRRRPRAQTEGNVARLLTGADRHDKPRCDARNGDPSCPTPTTRGHQVPTP